LPEQQINFYSKYEWIFEAVLKSMEKNLRQFIEEMIQKELDESAILSSTALDQGLAIYLSEEGGVTTIMLYDPKSYGTDHIIRGMIEIEKNFKCKAWTIVTSSAEKGYGPLMYDIAFSFAGNDGMMSSRASVSDAARKIWNFNYTTRKDDFEIIRLPPDCKFIGRDSQEPLNYKYVLKHRVDYSGFLRAHEQFLDSLHTNEQKRFFDELQDQATKFFNRKYFGR